MQAIPYSAPIHGAQLVVEGDAREVRLNGRPITLTRIEFDLLQELWNAPNRVLTHSYLLGIISGSSWFGDGHGLEVHICRLRRKLGESGSAPDLIRTVRGVGYKYVPPNPDAGHADGSTVNSIMRPLEFQTKWEVARQRPDANYMLRDGTLVVTAIDTRDETFLGWDPATLLNRFVSLSPQPMFFENQEAAVQVGTALARSGVTHIEQTELARTPHGLAWVHSFRRIWLSATGQLGGIENIYIPTTPPRPSIPG